MSEHVRLEPCDLPPERPAAPVYRLRKVKGEPVLCWLCEAHVPTRDFSQTLRDPGCEESVPLCAVCADLQHSNAAFYPSQYPELPMFRDLLKAVRGIIRQELNRGRLLP